jgi:hypothetical protein
VSDVIEIPRVGRTYCPISAAHNVRPSLHGGKASQGSRLQGLFPERCKPGLVSPATASLARRAGCKTLQKQLQNSLKNSKERTQ